MLCIFFYSFLLKQVPEIILMQRLYLCFPNSSETPLYHRSFIMELNFIYFICRGRSQNMNLRANIIYQSDALSTCYSLTDLYPMHKSLDFFSLNVSFIFKNWKWRIQTSGKVFWRINILIAIYIIGTDLSVIQNIPIVICKYILLCFHKTQIEKNCSNFLFSDFFFFLYFSQTLDLI